MSTEQIVLFTIFIAVFALLLWGRWRYDLVAFSALMAGVVFGAVEVEEAFTGFGHEATLIVALVLIVSAGLVRSGAVYLITRTLVDSSRSLGAHIALMGGIGGVLSAFMNNVAALALLMPVDIQTARKAGRVPGLSLMPLSFATILGGMATLIGTPPNIIIASIRAESLGEGYRMFDFAPVGGIAALAGLAFVALIGWRLIPVREDAAVRASDMANYVAELTVPEGSKQIGTRVGALAEVAEKADVAIIGVIRDDKRLYGNARNTVLRAGDALVLEATPEALDEFRSALSLAFSDERREELLKADSEGLDVIEVVIKPDSRMAGRTAQSIGLSWRQRAVVLGISRKGRRIASQVRRTEIEPGDILLILVQKDTGSDVAEWIGGLPLADRGRGAGGQRRADCAADRAWPGGDRLCAAADHSIAGIVHPRRMAGGGASRLHDPARAGAGDLGRHLADRRLADLGHRRLAGLGDPDGADGGDDDPVGRAQQHRHGDCRGTDRDPDGEGSGRVAGPLPDGGGGCRFGRVPDADRAQEQHADPRARRIPVRGLLAHGAAAGTAHHRGVHSVDPAVLAALEGGAAPGPTGLPRDISETKESSSSSLVFQISGVVRRAEPSGGGKDQSGQMKGITAETIRPMERFSGMPIRMKSVNR